MGIFKQNNQKCCLVSCDPRSSKIIQFIDLFGCFSKLHKLSFRKINHMVHCVVGFSKMRADQISYF